MNKSWSFLHTVLYIYEHGAITYAHRIRFGNYKSSLLHCTYVALRTYTWREKTHTWKEHMTSSSSHFAGEAAAAAGGKKIQRNNDVLSISQTFVIVRTLSLNAAKKERNARSSSFDGGAANNTCTTCGMDVWKEEKEPDQILLVVGGGGGDNCVHFP